MADTLVDEARKFATRAHADQGQRRKYTDQPYIIHPAAVASMVGAVGGDECSVAAAWLHDVLEDTSTSRREIYCKFGKEVWGLVLELTAVSKPSDGNRRARKLKDLLHLSHATPRAMTIKLADIIDNLPSVLLHAPDFAKVYVEEKRAELGVLTAGNVVLWRIANRIVSKYDAGVLYNPMLGDVSWLFPMPVTV